ncbi:unnamed protein product [Effrenium voratum]|uniref:DUF202 domain-containing protein n=1 Tax=Effrenium voratum TaxID=2562239 RepID=A0AA36MYA6_9DINO|nr:unnamed protein product [Effrenium voratum]
MAKTFWISWEDEGSESSFQLSVLPELSAADLSCCVRDRLGLVPSVPFYLTEESRKTGPALPLSPALPDGSRLRLVLPMGKSPFPAPGVAPAAPASAGGTAPAAAAADTQNCCVAEPGDPKQISTDLANERTLLAWLRTGLAAIRTVFSFATLSGLTKGELLLDVVVTLILSFSGLATLTVGRAHGISSPALGDWAALLRLHHRGSGLPSGHAVATAKALCQGGWA